MTDKTPKKPSGKKAAKKAAAEQQAQPLAKIETAKMEASKVTISDNHAQQEEAKPDKSFFGKCLSIIWFLIKLPFIILLLPFKIIFWPFRKLYRKWFGPAPLMFGPVPISHDEPDFESVEKTGLFKGQIVFILITAFFVVALYWASNAQLDEQVRAEGIVIPPSDIQIVQSRLPGSITDIYVDLGSAVKKGDVLFRVEDTDVQADFAENEIVIATSKIAIGRLEAEVAGQGQLSYPQDLITAAPEAAEKEASLFYQRRRALQEQVDVLEQSVEVLRRSIIEKTVEAEIAEQQAAIRKQEYDLLSPLVTAGHEPKIKLIEAETKWRQSQGAAELARLSAQSMEAEKQGKEREVLSIKSQNIADASAQLVEAQTRLAQAIARQESLAGRVSHADIRAPETGIISALHIKTVGAVVQAGTLLTEIVPDNTEMIVRARLLPQDVADVTLNQMARISLSAYDVSRYGALEGSVIHVASNTTEQEGVPPFYETLIAIPDPIFATTGVSPDIVPGMQVTVDIIGGKRTVMDYILSPIQRATEVAFREK